MSDKTSPDQPALPTLLDDELRDSLELFATGLASLSERIYEQSKVLAKGNLRRTEARFCRCWSAIAERLEGLWRTDS
jgi:hypothetical protein